MSAALLVFSLEVVGGLAAWSSTCLFSGEVICMATFWRISCVDFKVCVSGLDGSGLLSVVLFIIVSSDSSDEVCSCGEVVLLLVLPRVVSFSCLLGS